MTASERCPALQQGRQQRVPVAATVRQHPAFVNATEGVYRCNGEKAWGARHRNRWCSQLRQNVFVAAAPVLVSYLLLEDVIKKG